MITEKLAEIHGWKVGFLLHEGFLVKCSGIPDAEGNPVRHVICELDDHLPNTQAHAVSNPEFTDDLWIIDPAQSSIDWSNPTCRICGQGIAP